MNRLAHEKSPYLQQHQGNPVWWQPWDDQALQQAQRENKPIFLSIGYSTCHWCHVMEHESFENPDVAKLLNEHFVAIKVDREERPDLDDIYMNAVQQMTGHGGWPMSVWLTPDRKAFFGGTYFPRDNFMKLLQRIHEVWQQQEPNLRKDADRVHDIVEQVTRLPEAKDAKWDESILRYFVVGAEKMFDPQFGGFGDAPKFPQAMMLSALMRISRRLPDPVPEEWIVKTLDSMHQGGIYDHLMGGFHRYSTDEKWLVPHFEKMLYDNALLAMTYTEAFQYFGDLEYARVVRETLDYVLREMTDELGGFYSAQDADSLNPATGEKEEGFFATFFAAEIRSTVTEAEYQKLSTVYQISEDGDYEGRVILHLSKGHSREDQQDPTLQSALEKLRFLRRSRPAPHLDDKVIVEWNGLMIAALAKAAQVLEEPRYQLAAQKAARFCLQHMRVNTGALWRRWRQGEAGIAAFADDYVALIHGLLHLYETDFDPEWLRAAEELQAQLDAVYWDAKAGGYFRDSGMDTSLVTRIKDDYDGVTPTANSLACLNLLRLHALTFQAPYRERCETIWNVYATILERAPLGVSQMVSALDFDLDHSKEIAVIYEEGETAGLPAILRSLRVPFFPNQVVAVAARSQTAQGPALVHGKTALDQLPTVYICEGHTCQKPQTEPRLIERLAGQMKPLS